MLLHGLHILNDGVQASLLLLLPLIAAQAGFGALEIGTLTSVHFLMGVLLAVPAGILARRFGGLRVLLAAALLNALALTLLPQAANVWGTGAIVTLAGAGFGIFHPIAFALIGRWTTRESTSRAMGWFVATGDVGRSAMTALLAALLVTIAWQHASWLLAALLAVVAVCGLCLFPRPTAGPEDPPASHRGADAVPTVPSHAAEPSQRLLSNTRFLFACGIGGLDALANSGLYVFLPLLLAARGMDIGRIGICLSLYFLGGILGKVISSPVAARFGERCTLSLIQAVMAAVLISLATTHSELLLMLFSAFAGVLAKSSLPLVLSLTSAALPSRSTEVGFGINQTILGAATTISPLLLGAAAHFGAATSAVTLAAALSLGAALVARLPMGSREAQF